MGEWARKFRSSERPCLGDMSAAELVVDVELNDVVDGLVGGEAEGLGAGGLEAIGPGGDDLLDVGVGLPLDARDRALAGDAAEAVDHVADADLDARERQAAAEAPALGRQGV